MKSSMKRFADDAASNSTVEPGLTPMERLSARTAGFLRLIEEAAPLEQAGALLRRDLDVARGQQENLVRDALHAAVEGVREAAREVDQALRKLLLGRLQIQDHRDPVLEAIRDLLGVLERVRDDKMHADGR